AKPTAIEHNATGRSLSDLLRSGEIDATVGALRPDGFGTSSNIARLFPDFRKTEIDSYRRTGAHPIMHLLVMRRNLNEQQPWAARNLSSMLVSNELETWDDRPGWPRPVKFHGAGPGRR